MAPEVISDTHYSIKSDVYSFGILMYEVLTGEQAYSELYKKKNFNPFQITSKVVTGYRPTFNRPIQHSFKKLIEQCWAENPKERPTFHQLFHKLSLSLEDDDETIQASINELVSNETCNDSETEEIEYCLDNVDREQLFDYIDYIEDITRSENTHDGNIENQIFTRITTIEAQYQKEIDQLKSENQKIQQEIEELKKQNQNNQQQYQNEIKKLQARLNDIENHSNESKSEKSSTKSTITSEANSETKISLEGLTLEEIQQKIRKEKLTQIVIPASVKYIGYGAFSNFSSLTQITIPTSVTSIGKCAFFNCSSLTQITIPTSVTSIEGQAFENCASLTQITIPTSVASIGELAFYKCTSLTQITIPSSVTSIGRNLFAGCTNLEKIFVDSKNQKFVDVDGVLFDKDIQTIIYCPNGKKEANYTVPTSVTSIGESAFYWCKSLTQITIPSSVTPIGNHAFSNCTALTQITIPASVASIGSDAFAKCNNLDSSIKTRLKEKYGSRIF